MTLANLLAVLVVFVAVPLNWFVAGLLWHLSRTAPDLRTLRERAVIATAVALAVTAFAVLMVNNDLLLGIFDSDRARLISRIATLALSLGPAGYWLRIYWKGAA